MQKGQNIGIFENLDSACHTETKSLASKRPNRGEPRHRTRPTASPMSGGVGPKLPGVPRDTFAGETFRFCVTGWIEIFENITILSHFALKINRISYVKVRH